MRESSAAATILVVDDDDNVRVITADILALRGLEAPLLPKPFTMSALLGRVGALLGSALPERTLKSSA